MATATKRAKAHATLRKTVDEYRSMPLSLFSSRGVLACIAGALHPRTANRQRYGGIYRCSAWNCAAVAPASDTQRS